MAESLPNIFKEDNDLVKNPEIHVSGKAITVKLFLGGDMKVRKKKKLENCTCVHSCNQYMNC